MKPTAEEVEACSPNIVLSQARARGNSRGPTQRAASEGGRAFPCVYELCVE